MCYKRYFVKFISFVHKDIAAYIAIVISIYALIQANKAFYEPNLQVEKSKMEANAHSHLKARYSEKIVSPYISDDIYVCDPGVKLLLRNTGKIKAKNTTLQFIYPSKSKMRSYFSQGISTEYSKKQNMVFITVRDPIAARSGEIEIIIFSAVRKDNADHTVDVRLVLDASNLERREPSEDKFLLANLSRCE